MACNRHTELILGKSTIHTAHTGDVHRDFIFAAIGEWLESKS